jgi:imidazolonepropionase-like amidohydrolase
MPQIFLAGAKKLDYSKKANYADLIAVQGNPLSGVKVLENVKFAMKAGSVVRNDFAK